ncbi:DUF3108 domain-containing protein [Diaphorobacter sp.]|uniref:DUF3108 domain-containing protein n=1 Tax=Diaphorobacter sp. TaxID=1934310 RepID=UPI003D0DBBE7
MPRRALLLITTLVLALHWLALAGLPLGGTGQGAPQRLAFQTRMLEPPPAPQAPPEAAPQVAAPPPQRPPQHPQPARKPRPRPPQPAPTSPAPDTPASPDAAAEVTPATTPDTTASIAPDTAALITPQLPPDAAAETPPEAMPQAAAPAMPDASPLPSATEPQPPHHDAAAAPAGASADAPADLAAAAPPAAAPQPAPAEAAGVEIRLPGASGAVASSGPPPVRLPPSALLSFDVAGEVKQLRYSASAELLWRQDGARYEARQQIKAFLLGSRTQTSTGQINAQGLRPTRFGDKARSERAAHFDFERGEVIFSANSPRAPITDGAQDRLSVFIQLGAMLAAAPERYPPGTQITLTTVGPRTADRWSFTVEGPETLELPAGTTPALKLQRLPRDDQRRDQKAELWLGTAVGYLPVRIRITQSNGDFADLLLTGHEPH